jgi:hypothetical protein
VPHDGVIALGKEVLGLRDEGRGKGEWGTGLVFLVVAQESQRAPCGERVKNGGSEELDLRVREGRGCDIVSREGCASSAGASFRRPAMVAACRAAAR